MLADARIGVLIKMGTIEEGQAMGVLREVAWHPIEDHADALGVAAIYEGPEFIGCAEAAGGGIPAGYLIAP